MSSKKGATLKSRRHNKIKKINNPDKSSQFKKLKSNKMIINNVQNNEEDDLADTVPNEDASLKAEQLNKLHVSQVNQNNLEEINRKTLFINTDGGSSESGLGTSEKFYKDKAKSKEEADRKNASAGLSTNESNDSIEASKVNDRYLTPVFYRNFPKTPMMPFTQGKRINFNNYMQGFKQEGFGKSSSVCVPSNMSYNYNMAALGNENKFNLQMAGNGGFPNGAFTYNYEKGSLSERKRMKKSKEEVDQTLFTIKLDNILRCKDSRTTVMIRHIPNKYSTYSLLDEINALFKNKFDFFYLPMDYEVTFHLISEPMQPRLRLHQLP